MRNRAGAVPAKRPSSVRQSVTIPAQLAIEVERVAKREHLTMSRALVRLAERGVEAETEARENLNEAYRRFMSESDPKLKTEAGQDLVRAIFGTDAIAENGWNRELGKARGLIREIDPDWWKPMTDEEAARLFDLRAQHHE